MTRHTSELRVCVSVPIGYGSKFFKSSLGSLKAQNEYLDIAIMDASGDPAVAQEIAQSGVQTTYHRCAPDGGQSDAIAEGWARSTAPILAWLNADDMLLENCIPMVLAAFEANPNIDLIYGHSSICNEEGDVLGLHSAVKPVSNLIYRDNYISQPSCFIRRSALEKIGGIDKSLHYTMDWDLWLRLYDNGHEFMFIDEIFSNVSWVTDTKTSQISIKRYKEFAAILHRSQGLMNVAKGVVSSVLQTHGVYRDQTKWGDSLLPLYNGKPHATLPIINATETAQRRLECRFSKPTKDYVVSCKSGDITWDGATAWITFHTAIKAGECGVICIDAKNSSDDMKLIEAKWA
ncbi:glycosyltransferase family 2 protein [Litorimonas cladophorae]|nr:glycosyltransferase family 2 protein [Litorimonas cladophorae]